MPKPIPNFKSEDEEREFWATHDSTEYLEWDQAKKAVFPKLKPSTKTISLRMPESMLNEIRVLANKRDVPYQSLIKVFLRERIDSELYKQREPTLYQLAERNIGLEILEGIEEIKAYKAGESD